MMPNNFSMFALAGALTLAACANQNATQPPSTATGQGPQTTTTATKTVSTSSTQPVTGATQLSVSDELRMACNIDFTASNSAPKFDFDESQLDEGDRTVLGQVAKCVTTGPLRGRSLQLVGRADPRGETEYNMVLGGSRAASVGAYLSQLGVQPGKLTQTSRGKLDATGTDEAGWRMDRRVDILLST
jgi:peptidoglycan-associated lipoprotein